MKSFLCGSGAHGSTSRRLWDRSTDLSCLGSGRLEPSFLIAIRWRGVLSEVGGAEGREGAIWGMRPLASSVNQEPSCVHLPFVSQVRYPTLPGPCLCPLAGFAWRSSSPSAVLMLPLLCQLSSTHSPLPHRAQLRALRPPSRSLFGLALTRSHYIAYTVFKLRSPPEG